MAGNVNEWVLAVYRPLTYEDFAEYSPFRGNVYTEIQKDADGNALPKDRLGRLQRDTIGYVPNRYNYNVGDNRNYKDGDPFSSIDGNVKETNAKVIADSDRMYFQGTGEDEAGMTTLISDHSLVYKGGSFLDRVYWLSPGARRFLDERRSSIDIGFRCAMDVLGDPAALANNKKKRK